MYTVELLGQGGAQFEPIATGIARFSISGVTPCGVRVTTTPASAEAMYDLERRLWERSAGHEHGSVARDGWLAARAARCARLAAVLGGVLGVREGHEHLASKLRILELCTQLEIDELVASSAHVFELHVAHGLAMHVRVSHSLKRAVLFLHERPPTGRAAGFVRTPSLGDVRVCAARLLGLSVEDLAATYAVEQQAGVWLTDEAASVMRNPRVETQRLVLSAHAACGLCDARGPGMSAAASRLALCAACLARNAELVLTMWDGTAHRVTRGGVAARRSRAAPVATVHAVRQMRVLCDVAVAVMLARERPRRARAPLGPARLLAESVRELPHGVLLMVLAHLASATARRFLR
jgi:hypothetical protein